MKADELRVKAEEVAARLRRLPTGGAGESHLAAVYGPHDWKTLQELELRDRWFLADVWMMQNWWSQDTPDEPGYWWRMEAEPYSPQPYVVELQWDDDEKQSVLVGLTAGTDHECLVTEFMPGGFWCRLTPPAIGRR